MDGRFDGDPHARCAQSYADLRWQWADKGLDAMQVKQSRSDSDVTGTHAVLRPHACSPTGVALGAPFEHEHRERLGQLALDVEALVSDQDNGPAVAFVPKPILHVTVVNRSHFEAGAALDDLSAQEYAAVAEVIEATVRQPIAIELRGLIVTTGGRLLVPGYPVGGELFELRRRLVERLPQLGVRTPRTAHIKLGHLLVVPGAEGLRRVSHWLERQDADVSTTLTFVDFYTPVRRIGIGSW